MTTSVAVAETEVQSETSEGVTTLWLNRPALGNALGPTIVETLNAALEDALKAGARLIVLRGRGRHFCTGFDLSDIEATTEGDLALRIIRIELVLQRLHALPVPTLAVANGRAFGAGADLFAACDYRLAMPTASFAFPGPAFGLVLGTGRLAGRVGGGPALQLLLGGEAMTAEAACGLGLATAVLTEEALPAALKEVQRAALRLDAPTVAALRQRTRQADDAADLAALARSVARPGLKSRIEAYRAQALAAAGRR